MRYVLDTNVVTELRNRRGLAEESVLTWVGSQSSSDLAISVITVLEIELGVARLERRDRAAGASVRAWFEDQLMPSFAGRVLEVDLRTARAAARMHVPDPRPERDALIAATALTRDLVVVTRNVADFAPLGVVVVDPWSAGAERG